MTKTKALFIALQTPRDQDHGHPVYITDYNFYFLTHTEFNVSYCILHFIIYVLVAVCRPQINGYCLSNAFDRLANHFGFCLCACLVHRSVVERLRPQVFTDLHHILHAAWKFGCFEYCCF